MRGAEKIQIISNSIVMINPHAALKDAAWGFYDLAHRILLDSVDGFTVYIELVSVGDDL